MKKKFFVGIAAAALAAVMCVAFVGCGESGGGKAKSIKGYEVTEDQWNAATEELRKDEAIFTVDYIEEMKSEASAGGLKGSQTRTATITAIKNGAKEYIKMTDVKKFTGVMAEPGSPAETEDIDEMYAERVGNGYTIYEQNEQGNWEKTDEHGDSIIPFSVVLSKINSNKFSDYTYSTKDKGYVKSGTEEDDNRIIIKFDQEGRISAIYSGYSEKNSASGMSSSVSYTFSVVITYTAKDITIPTVA